MANVHVVALLGSLRQDSLNKRVLAQAYKALPEGMTMETAEIGDIPLYNDDVRAAGFPPAVQRLREQLARADAVLFVSPEYNYSIPGVLQNAIDWASRQPNPPFAGKAAGIMGAATGIYGTARMQYHLRQVLTSLNMHPVNKPEVMVPQVQNKLDEAGNLSDEATVGFIRQHLEALCDLALKLRGESR